MFVVDSEHDKYDCNSLQADQLVYILLVTVLMGGDNTGSYRKISESECSFQRVENLQRVQ